MMDFIPLAVLFGEPSRITPQISPDGRKLAYLAANGGGVLNIRVKSIGRDDDRRLTAVTERGIVYFNWAADSRHIFYLLDHAGDENWRLYDIDIETSAERDLTPFDHVSVQIVGIGRRHPESILVAMNRRDPGVYDVYRLDPATGRADMVVENPGLFTGWTADADLVVRAALSPLSDGAFDLMVRDTGEAPWRKLLTWAPEDTLTSGPIGFSGDGRSIYLIDSRGTPASRLVAMEIESGRMTAIAGDAGYDINQVMLHPDDKTVQAVSFFRERNAWQVFDADLREDFRVLSAISDGNFYVIGRDQRNSIWIIDDESDVGPIGFYLYRRADKTREFLFDHEPRLRDYRLAPMRPITFTARDGLKLHGYLTLPRTFSGTKPPLVVKVHGGPWVRDQWGFDPEVQWLADRGFACLQINFRGSAGYGKAFINAGNGEWGRKMVDDLVDGVRWAAARGDVDPARTAVIGVSYGGYTALVAAARHPDIFRCAVDVAGPTDLAAFLRELPPQWNPYKEIFFRSIGDPEKDAARLKERSPIHMASKFRIPVMIVHGVNDVRVNKAHSDRMAAALRRECPVPPHYLEYQDEGHSIGNASNRLQFYMDAERFLRRHLNDDDQADDVKLNI